MNKRPESRTGGETGGGKRHAGPEIEIETRSKRRFCVLVLLSFRYSPQGQEMVLLHTGNELMGEIRLDNGSGNQIPVQQRGT